MKKRDLVLIGAVLLVAAAGFLFLSLVKKDGERVVAVSYTHLTLPTNSLV